MDQKMYQIKQLKVWKMSKNRQIGRGKKGGNTKAKLGPPGYEFLF